MDEPRRFSPTDRIKSERGRKRVAGNVVRTRERMWIVFCDVHRSTGDWGIATQLHQCTLERGWTIIQELVIWRHHARQEPPVC